MYQFSKAEGECMLNLAREAITTLLNTGKPYTCAPESLMAEVREVHAAFVTLTMDGALRGCIGHIEAIQPLYLDIIENACNAALRDPRFSPVNKAEFENIVVEVSVMRPFEPFDYASCDALIEKIEREHSGVLIKSGAHQALFLPQVWEQLPTAEEFLGHLCLKAGLEREFWRECTLDIALNSVMKFKE